MLTKFGESLGEKLAERWTTTLLAPAFGFWFGGGVIAVAHFKWPIVEQSFTALAEPLQITLLVGALLLVAASAAAVAPFTLAALRLLEGYWPRRMQRLPTAWQNRRAARDERRWQDLALKAAEGGGPGALTPAERDDYAALDRRLRRFPADPAQRLPTRLGNILRAAELRPLERYGLETVICWPRLWLLLPDAARSELAAARARLDATARLWIWGMLFIGWTVWAWQALPVGLLVAFFAYRSALSAAEVYGDLLEAAFDLYRTQLYEALGFSPPSADDEIAAGQRLTEYLLRGPQTFAAGGPQD